MQFLLVQCLLNYNESYCLLTGSLTYSGELLASSALHSPFQLITSCHPSNFQSHNSSGNSYLHKKSGTLTVLVLIYSWQFGNSLLTCTTTFFNLAFTPAVMCYTTMCKLQSLCFLYALFLHAFCLLILYGESSLYKYSCSEMV